MVSRRPRGSHSNMRLVVPPWIITMEPIAGGRNPFFLLASMIVVCALVVVFAGVALASWPTADDYCNRVMVAERGVDGAMRWLFSEWSGRLVTSSVLYSTFALVDL